MLQIISMRKVESSNLRRVKAMTSKMYICHYLDWFSALIGWDKDWLAQCQDNVTGGYIGNMVV